MVSCVTTNKIPDGPKIQSRSANYLPLSTILTYYETGDKPTQDQFEDSWANSYNAVSDGIFDLTGYPSIGFTPYSTLQVGKFSQGNLWPTDTTTRLIWNGTFVVPNLWVNGQKWTGTGSSEWTLNAGTLYPTSTLTNVAINATSSAGYDLYVSGTANITSSVTTNVINSVNGLGLAGAISIDGSGNMQFVDENTTAVTLSSLLGSSGAWARNGEVVWAEYDTLVIGHVVDDMQDSAFTVWGTSMFRRPVYFDSTIFVSGVLSTDRYIETPSLNLAYDGNTGRMDLYDPSGRITLYDSDYPTGVTLSQLNGGEWSRTAGLVYPISPTDDIVIGGTTASPLFDLTVIGGSYFQGQSAFGNGMSLAYGSRINFTNGYITNSPLGLIFNDSFNGDKTLTELLGVTQDSMSVSRFNTDTAYFNGVTTKSIYSPHSNNIFVTSNLEEWRFEEFEAGASDYGVFHSDAFLFKNLIPDATQTTSGFAVRGRTYMSAEDSTYKYFTGKASEWRTLATEEWVTEALLGGIGSSPTFDTIWVDANNYITTGGTFAIQMNSDYISATQLSISLGASSSGFSWGGLNAHINASVDSLSFLAGGGYFVFDGTYWHNSTDTLSTQAYARTMGGGGSGGIGDLDLYPDASPDTFITANGALLAYFATGLFNSSTSFITGYPSTADSVKIGKKLQISNDYAAETALKYSQKLFGSYAGGYLDDYSQVYTNYSDANANNGEVYGLYSHLYVDENYAASGNTSYSNAGKFILQNRGTTTIGGGSPGTLYMNGLYSEITGVINADATPGTYVLSAIYGKSSITGTAIDYAGYFDGDVTVNGALLSNGTFGIGNGTGLGAVNTSDWNISIAGAMTGISGITNDAAITSTGGIVSLNASSNYAINLATGTSTGAISIGGGSNTVAVNSTSWDITTAGAVSGLTTLSMSGQLTSTLATGTPPFAVTSTTVNTNLNAGLLDGQTGSYYQTATNMNTGTLPGDRGVSAGSATSSFVEYNGTTLTASQFYGGTSLPTGTTRLNYGGYLYDTRHYSDRYYSNALSAITDTMAAVWYPGGYLDSAQMVISASKGWDITLEDFDTYYSKAEQLKALPLPYPNGTERRKPNAMYANYQFEFELERLTRYFKEERDKNKILTERIAKLEKQSGIKVKKNRRKNRT
jgi:hypothetical protein